MDNQIQIPLNLPDVRVLEAHQTLKSEWLIRVESLGGGTTCHKCGERITEFHGFDAPLRLRHLPLFEVPVYLELCPKRYRCRRCAGGPTTTEQPILRRFGIIRRQINLQLHPIDLNFQRVSRNPPLLFQ